MSLSQIDCIPNRRRPRLTARIAVWIALARQRRALAALTQAQREDIGISAQQAEAEANRPVWDVPASWRYKF